MTLLNIVYIPKCNSNLILLGQFWELGILYHNYPKSLILKQRRSILGIANREKNLFILKTGPIGKVMLVQRRSRPTYHLIANPKIWLWNYHLKYASNARVVQASKLVDRIDLREAIGFNKSYSSDAKLKNENFNNQLITINKAIENKSKYIEQLCKSYIKSKHIQIVKSKKMTPITKKL